MSSLHIVLALCVTLTMSLSLNQGRHDLLGGVGEGVGSANSAPLNMEILASVDITPSTPSEPLSIGVDRTTSVVKPDVEIAFSFVPRDNLIPTADVGTLETGEIPREAGGSTTAANTGTQTSPHAGSDASFPNDSKRWSGYYRQHLTSCVRRHKADFSRCIQRCKPTAPSYRSRGLQNPISIQKTSQAWWSEYTRPMCDRDQSARLGDKTRAKKFR